MTPTTAQLAEAGRFGVRSSDGTSIAVRAGGDGPPIVVVHGALHGHTTDRPFIDERRGTFTTFAMTVAGAALAATAPPPHRPSRSTR